jgi:hypothetical protein
MVTIKTLDNEIVYQTAGLLLNNGWVKGLDKEGNVIDGLPLIGVEDGDYIIEISHRNHLKVASMQSVSIIGGEIRLFDFTKSKDQCNPSQAVINPCGSAWTICGGDLNQDGHVTTKDYVIWYNGKTGPIVYENIQDINLDGNIDTRDFHIILSNARKGIHSCR